MKFEPKQFFTRLYEKTFDEDIFSSAAQVGFYFMFALFPLLLFLISLMGLVLEKADDIRAELFVYLRQVMPGSAIDLVQKTLEEVVQSSSGGKLTIGFIIALWSASAGIDSVRVALNSVYKLKETRPYWQRKGASLLLTLAIAVLIFIALGVIFYGSQFLALALSTLGLPIPSPMLLKILSFVVVAIVLTVAFALLYNFAPNHVPFAWNWISPGAIVAIILWVLASLAFRLYLHYFNSYAATYGSLGAIIILMLWLYITALAIIIGGAINAILNEFSEGRYTKETRPSVEENEREREIAETETPESTNDKPETESKSSAHAVGKTGISEDSKKANNAPDGERSVGKMVAGGVLGGLIAFFSKKKK